MAISKERSTAPKTKTGRQRANRSAASPSDPGAWILRNWAPFVAGVLAFSVLASLVYHLAYFLPLGIFAIALFDYTDYFRTAFFFAIPTIALVLTAVALSGPLERAAEGRFIVGSRIIAFFESWPSFIIGVLILVLYAVAGAIFYSGFATIGYLLIMFFIIARIERPLKRSNMPWAARLMIGAGVTYLFLLFQWGHIAGTRALSNPSFDFEIVQAGGDRERVSVLRILSSYIVYMTEPDGRVVIRTNEDLQLETTHPWFVGPYFDLFGLQSMYEAFFLGSLNEKKQSDPEGKTRSARPDAVGRPAPPPAKP